MADQPLVDIPIQPQTPVSKPVQGVKSPSSGITQSTGGVQNNTGQVGATPPLQKPTQNMPSSQQMLTDLQATQGSKPNSTPPSPAAPAQTNQETNSKLEELTHWSRPILKYARLTVAVALTMQSLYGLFKNIKFILIDYPALEVMLLNHEITQDQVTNLGTKALMTLITTIVGLFFAMRIIRSKAAKNLNTAIGIALIFLGTYLNTYLSTNLDIISIISGPVEFFFRILGRAGGAVNESVEQLPINTTNPPTIKWEQ